MKKGINELSSNNEDYSFNGRDVRIGCNTARVKSDINLLLCHFFSTCVRTVRHEVSVFRPLYSV